MNIKNTGHHAAAEIAQLYLMASPNATMPMAPIKLIGFEKTERLSPDSSTTVSFIITAEHRSVVLDYDHTQAVEPGVFPLWVGGAQPGGMRDGGALRASLTNTGSGPLASCGI